MATMTLASYTFLVVLVITSCLPYTHTSPVEAKKSTEFIRRSCGATTYPVVCFKSLSSYASTIQTSPMQLAQAALSVSLAGARSTLAMMSSLSAGGRQGMRRSEVSAMGDCVEVIGDSVDELRQSLAKIRHLSGGDIGLKMNDIQTWVSAALTNENTCMDGFDGMQGKVRDAVHGKVVSVAQLTSNALALINKLANTVHVTNP